MLAIHYSKTIPYQFDVVLSQYYDYEHIEHVHPTTLGKFEVLETGPERVVYKQTWPAGFWGRRATSVVEQRFTRPNDIRFRFLAGKHRGVEVHSVLHDRGAETLVEETYFLRLPDWNWLRRLVRPFVVRAVEAIWEEDLRVGVCIDGWPGVPAEARTGRAAGHAAGIKPLVRVTAAEVRERGKVVLHVAGEEVLVVASAGEGCLAVSNRCPHAGGPLSQGACDGRTVTCPWHGARFELDGGKLLRGPGPGRLSLFHVNEENGRIEVSPREAS